MSWGWFYIFDVQNSGTLSKTQRCQRLEHPEQGEIGWGTVFFYRDSLEEDYGLCVVLVSSVGDISNWEQALSVCFDDYMDV